jgi:hypothetical protein
MARITKQQSHSYCRYKKKIYGKSPKFLKSIFFETNFQNVKTLKFGNLLSFLGKIKSLFDFFL